MVSPSLEGRQSGDNDRQVDLVVVLCCPSGSGLCPFSPLQEWKREGGRKGGGLFDHCLQIQLAHAQERKSSLPPSSHVLCLVLGLTGDQGMGGEVS